MPASRGISRTTAVLPPGLARVPKRSNPGDRPALQPDRRGAQGCAREVAQSSGCDWNGACQFLPSRNVSIWRWGSRMLHKWWGVGLVVVLGLVWLALGERPDSALPALKAQQQAAPVAE